MRFLYSSGVLLILLVFLGCSSEASDEATAERGTPAPQVSKDESAAETPSNRELPVDFSELVNAIRSGWERDIKRLSAGNMETKVVQNQLDTARDFQVDYVRKNDISRADSANGIDQRFCISVSFIEKSLFGDDWVDSHTYVRAEFRDGSWTLVGSDYDECD